MSIPKNRHAAPAPRINQYNNRKQISNNSSQHFGILYEANLISHMRNSMKLPKFRFSLTVNVCQNPNLFLLFHFKKHWRILNSLHIFGRMLTLEYFLRWLAIHRVLICIRNLLIIYSTEAFSSTDMLFFFEHDQSNPYWKFCFSLNLVIIYSGTNVLSFVATHLLKRLPYY